MIAHLIQPFLHTDQTDLKFPLGPCYICSLQAFTEFFPVENNHFTLH